MDHDSCSSSYSSCTSRSYSNYTSSSNDATSHDEPPLALFQQLENEISTNLHLGVDLSKFAQEVWGLERETVEKVLAMPIVLEESEVQAFREGRVDDTLHKSFLAISNRILTQAAKELGDEENGTFTDTFWDRLRQNPACGSRHSVPDVVNTWKPLPFDGAAPTLSVVKSVFELKRISMDNGPQEEQADEEEGLEEREAGDEEDAENGDSDRKEYKVIPDSTDSTADQRSLGSEASKQTTSTLKRSFDSVKDTGDDEGRSVKKQRFDDKPALSNSLLPLYATEAMASGSRYYIVGLVVDRFTVTVCYFDRFVVTCVASFSFEEEPSKLALALYAMNRCGRFRAGFDPHLRAVPGANGAERTRPVEDVVGSVFEYPDTSSSPGICLRVKGVIRRPDELIGRATAVYTVQRRLPDGKFSDEELVYKLSWPSKNRLSEIEVVERLNKRLPEEAHDHFPNFLFSRSFTAEDLNLPWLRLGLSLAEKHEGRVLRGMLGRFYHKLWEAGSIENFKQAWLDCVEGLYLARKLGKVLHRDLSEGNLMILQLADGKVKGVLNDWDLAQFVDANDSNDVSDDEHRTGTPPFMAHDHLRMQRVPHWFRHDLESLFYILVWAALHYNLKQGTRDRQPHPVVAGWMGSRDDNRSSKLFLLMYDTDLVEEAAATVKPEFAGVLKEWIGPLQFLFANASLNHHKRLRTDPNAGSDPATWGGDLTFKKFMAAINVPPRTWGIPNFLDDDEF